MGKLSKEEQARFSGADWMVRYAKKHGLEEAEKELERRGVRNMPLRLNNSDVEVFMAAERQNIINYMLVDTILTLHDVFDFEREQCKEFIERWNDNMACLADGYVDWRELRDTINEEIGIWIPLSDKEGKDG